MAILCLAESLEDMEARLGRIVVAYTRDRAPVTARDLKADGAMAVLLAGGDQAQSRPDAGGQFPR